jgi:hypothetical protein
MQAPQLHWINGDQAAQPLMVAPSYPSGPSVCRSGERATTYKCSRQTGCMHKTEERKQHKRNQSCIQHNTPASTTKYEHNTLHTRHAAHTTPLYHQQLHFPLQ